MLLLPALSFGQKAIRIKASTVDWNRCKLAERIKIKLHFSNTYITRSTVLQFREEIKYLDH
jgi:hypothetical protein